MEHAPQLQMPRLFEKMRGQQKYSSLSSRGGDATVSEEAGQNSRCSKSPQIRLKIISFLFGTIGCLIGVFGVTIFQHLITKTNSPAVTLTPTSSQSCGGSPSEALSRGCSFDVMSFSWLPPACFDAPLTEDFLFKHSWQWFDEPSGTAQVLPMEAVLNGTYSKVFVTWEYHITHCLYMWRKMHRAILNGSPLDGYIGEWDHTLHCQMRLLERETGLDEMGTYLMMKYPSCGD